MKISKQLSDINKDVSLLCFTYQADVTRDGAELWKYIDNKIIKSVENSYTLENLAEQKEIKSARETYRAIGKDPSRYRVSSEALIRRILQGKGLYKVNNVVDCNNLISIQTGLSCGSYDVDKLVGDLVFRIGHNGESYQGIGKDEINIEHLPVFADNTGAYGSPTSDSRRAMITEQTKNVMTALISFSGVDVLNKYGEIAENYISKFLNAKNIQKSLIRS